MKNIKQIREAFDAASKGSDSEQSRLATLIRAGLMDTTKLPTIKRALSKDNRVMTPAEKNSLLNLLDSLMSQVLADRGTYMRVKTNLHEATPTQTRNDYLSKFDPRFGYKYPKESSIPTVLIMKRKAIRIYPDGQKVALYYAQAIDKYVSIPFQDANTGINEEMQQLDEISSKLQNTVRAKRKEQGQQYSDAADAESDPAKKAELNKKASKAFSKSAKTNRIIKRRERRDANYGSSWYELGKAHRKKVDALRGNIAKKIKSMRASKKTTKPAEKPAETVPAKAPEAKPVTVAMPASTAKAPTKKRAAPSGTFASRMPVNEAFYARLNVLREQQLNEYSASDAAGDAADILIPGVSAYKNFKKGNYGAAALDAAIDVGAAALAAPTLGGSLAARAGAKAALKGGAKLAAKTGAKAVAKTAAKTAGKAGGKLGKVGRFARKAGKMALVGAALGGSGASSGSSQPSYRKATDDNYNFKTKASTTDSFAARKGSEASRKITESNFQLIKKVNDQVLSEATLSFDDKQITINNTVAKKIVNLHESVNKTNKKMIEKMLDESAGSFNKILTFAIRH